VEIEKSNIREYRNHEKQTRYNVTPSLLVIKILEKNTGKFQSRQSLMQVRALNWKTGIMKNYKTQLASGYMASPSNKV
jgi:hypothetical protein